MPETIRCEIEAVPPTINRLSRMHWAERRNQKTLWTDLIWNALGAKNLKMLRAWAKDGERVRIEIVAHHAREFDPDNVHSIGKLPLDSLKSLGCIPDDSAKFIEFHASQVKAKKPRTILTIGKL